VPSTLRPVHFTLPRPQAPSQEALPVEAQDVVALNEAQVPAPEVRMDPASAAVYATAKGPPARPRVLHQLALQLPPGGELLLDASAMLSSGFDREHWRRNNFEQAHALHKRPDAFVYQFAARGPAGPVVVRAEPDTVAQARLQGDVVRAAAAARRPPPLGLTLGLGPAVSSLPGGSGTLTQGLLRASLELLLPHRDAVALALEAGSDLQAGHHLGAALLYQLYTPVWPYLPLGGHLDAGVACDFWQSLGAGQGIAGAPSMRCGPRLAIGLNAAFIGLSPSLDLFPLSEPVAGSSESHFTAHYRVAILGTVGL
jgi:hypothetical protein